MAGCMVSATEFQQNVGKYIEESAKHPIVITRYDTPRRVLLDMEEYERLLEKDNRVPEHVSEMSDEAVANMMDPANWPKE